MNKEILSSKLNKNMLEHFNPVKCFTISNNTKYNNGSSPISNCELY